MIICNNIIGLSPPTPQKARIRGSAIFLCGRKFTTYFWNSQENLVREFRFYGLFRITFEKFYKIMVQKYGCGSRNANNQEPDTKRIKSPSPISLNDNPIMYSIPEQPSSLLESCSTKTNTILLPERTVSTKQKKYPSFTARVLKVFAKTLFKKLNYKNFLFRFNISVQQLSLLLYKLNEISFQ